MNKIITAPGLYLVHVTETHAITIDVYPHIVDASMPVEAAWQRGLRPALVALRARLDARAATEKTA